MFDNVFPKIVPFVITWKNTVQPGRPQMTIWRTRISRWVPKATNTDSEYVIFIAFPLLQRFTNEPLCCVFMYTACLATYCSDNFKFRTAANRASPKQNVFIILTITKM